MTRDPDDMAPTKGDLVYEWTNPIGDGWSRKVGFRIEIASIDGRPMPVATVGQFTTDLTDYDNESSETDDQRRDRLRARFHAIMAEMEELTDELKDIFEELYP